MKVNLLVDKRQLKQGAAPRSHERLKTLKTKGAKVSLCSGKSYRRVFGKDGRPGIYHCKGVVVDGVTSYVGWGNLTDCSEVNGEMWTRITGAQVAKDTEAMIWSEANWVELL